jgi:hypothetical protein
MATFASSRFGSSLKFIQVVIIILILYVQMPLLAILTAAISFHAAEIAPNGIPPSQKKILEYGQFPHELLNSIHPDRVVNSDAMNWMPLKIWLLPVVKCQIV